MSSLKTRPTGKSVREFLLNAANPRMRADCRVVARMMRQATGKRARMWGSSIVGYGSYSYSNSQGESEWPLISYSPRGRDLTIYFMPGFSAYQSLLRRLGKYRTGKSCLYIRNLDDVDQAVLNSLVGRAVKDMRLKYDCS